MAAPTYDDRQWPLFRIWLPDTAMSTQELTAYLDRVDALFLRGQRFVLVIDTRGAPAHTPVERQAIAQRMRASHERYPELMPAMAIVLSSALERGIFTAINWLAGPTYPMRAFATMTEAEAWLLGMLYTPLGPAALSSQSLPVAQRPATTGRPASKSRAPRRSAP